MSGESEVPAKRSAVELQKEQSRALRGSILEELAKETEKFGDADKTLLKFHGTYQQEDRDARKARRGEGLGKFHMFMVRCKIPGGRLTAAQYLAVDDLAGRCANGTLRFTSRQGIQLHGVLKRDLKATIAASMTVCSPRWAPAATSSATSWPARPRSVTARCTTSSRPPLLAWQLTWRHAPAPITRFGSTAKPYPR